MGSLHHGRQDEKRSGVYRNRYQYQHRQHQADRDQYAAQRPGFGIVDAVARLNVLHDEGLPGRSRCHTSSPGGYRSTGG
jgi:hypothetical protein